MSTYGYCPKCGAPGKYRERRPYGNDRCEKGCVYPSAESVPWSPESEMRFTGADLREAFRAGACYSAAMETEGCAAGFPDEDAWVAAKLKERTS